MRRTRPALLLLIFSRNETTCDFASLTSRWRSALIYKQRSAVLS